MMVDASRLQSMLEQGESKAQSGDMAGAIEAYTEVLTLAPDSIAALERKAAALVTISDFEHALACYTDLVTRKPEDAGWRVARARVLSYLKRYADAIEDLRAVVELRGPDVSVLKELGLCLRRAGRLDEAAENYK